MSAEEIEENSTSISDMLRRVEITSKCRYNAARRLQLHSVFSQWTLAVLAVGQIVISLVATLGLNNNYSPAYTNFGGIFFGVLVLAYSLLLGMGNYAARSLTMHTCGMELGDLARQLRPHKDCNQIDSPLYQEAHQTYYAILSKCENHALCDYLSAVHQDLWSNLRKGKRTNLNWKTTLVIIYDWINCTFLEVAQFFHYFFTLTLLSAWVFVMIVK